MFSPRTRSPEALLASFYTMKKTSKARKAPKLNLHGVFLSLLVQLHSSEKQQAKALRSVARKVQDEGLRERVEDHADQTQVHVERIESILERLDIDRDFRSVNHGLTAAAIADLEAAAAMPVTEPALRDAAIITALQVIEHIEMALYGTVRTHAEMLGDLESAQILQCTLDEEGEQDKHLTDISVGLVVECDPDEDAE